ncbi:MAG: hypothetical protein U9N33_01935 [Campylobacterota bacterium]|nr:hypothetical protein [Campylobacterota bacterium]
MEDRSTGFIDFKQLQENPETEAIGYFAEAIDGYVNTYRDLKYFGPQLSYMKIAELAAKSYVVALGFPHEKSDEIIAGIEDKKVNSFMFDCAEILDKYKSKRQVKGDEYHMKLLTAAWAGFILTRCYELTPTKKEFAQNVMNKFEFPPTKKIHWIRGPPSTYLVKR